LVEPSQQDLHTGNDRNKGFRSWILAITLALFILAISTLQILSILISETLQSVYGQTQATVTDNNNIVRDLSWTLASLDNNLKPTSNVITIAALISDNGNNNTTPILLPLPSSSQSSDNNSSPPAGGLASTTSPSSNNVVNSDSPSQGHNSNKENSTNTHHDSHSSSQTNIVSSSDNQLENQHNKHKHGSTGDIINQVVSQSRQQFTGGQIPFP
jgi:hypothetical protein